MKIFSLEEWSVALNRITDQVVMHESPGLLITRLAFEDRPYHSAQGNDPFVVLFPVA